MFCRPLTPAAWICRTIGSTFAAKASGGRTVGLVRLGLRLGQVGAVAEAHALRLPLRQRQPRALGDQRALFLGQRGIDVQHEHSTQTYLPLRAERPLGRALLTGPMAAAPYGQTGS